MGDGGEENKLETCEVMEYKLGDGERGCGRWAIYRVMLTLRLCFVLCRTGGLLHKGKVTDVGNWTTTSIRSAVSVVWETNKKNLYRVGFEGRVSCRHTYAYLTSYLLTLKSTIMFTFFISGLCSREGKYHERYMLINRLNF